MEELALDKTEEQEKADLAVLETALVDYTPKSKAPFQLGTLIPRNMAFEVHKALNRVIQNYGNLDNYVRDQLKYETVEALWKGLAAEQVDSVALYLSQFERKQGIIIGDQTGIGKGRQAAAIIRHSVLNGYLPVFFTRKPDLFSDMYRDLKSIGFADIHPFLLNTDSNAKMKDADGHAVFHPLDSKTQYEELVLEHTIPTDSMEAIAWYKRIGKSLPDPEKQPTLTLSETIDYLPPGYDMIFCTYSQVQAAHYYKRDWLEKIVTTGIEGSKKHKKVIFVLDESHMAGGYDSIIGKWMRRVLPLSRSCGFLSATFAKYPEVMPLYATKTAIQEAAMEDEPFVSAMRKGGLALQEIVASNLAESGQLIRRQRSKEGIEVVYHTLDQEPQRSLNRDRVDRIINIMNQIVQFETDYISPIMAGIHSDAKSKGEHIKDKPKSLGVKQSPYFSRVFNIIDQMLFAVKVEEVAQKAIDLLQQNKKVVIAFKSTMGAFLKDLNMASGDRMSPDQLDFVRTLVKGLDSTFFYNYTTIDNVKSRMRVELEELPPDGLQRYEEIKEAIWDESTGLSISPIDQLIQIIQSTDKPKEIGGHNDPKYRVAEVTGRNQRVSFQGEEAIVESFRTDVEKFFRLFNSGKYDVLLINTTGSTGASAHASVDFQDQRQRWMLIHQFELDINTEMQKRGRINRTNQVLLPGYLYISTDIPAELRLLTMLKGKLKSLDANTTGSQKTSDDALRSADFMNKYGDQVAFQWATDNPQLVERMGWPTYHYEYKDGEKTLERNENRTGAMRQITGRAGLLTVVEQDTLYTDLLERYESHVNWEKQKGTYDLETEFLKLDADIKKRFLFKQGSGGTTPFGKDTVRDETIVNNLKRPLTKDELDGIIVQTLKGKTPTQILNSETAKLEQAFPDLLAKRKAKGQIIIDALVKDLESIPEPGSVEDEKESEKLSRQRERKEELIRFKSEQLDHQQTFLQKSKEQLLKYMQMWKIGDVVQIPLSGISEPSWGIYIGLEIGSSDNPVAGSNTSLKFAVADFRRIVKFNLTEDQIMGINAIFTSSADISPADIQKVNSTWNDMVRNASQKREKRQILTENIVGAADYLGAQNKLIKYNTKDGSIKNGILLKRSDDNEEIPAVVPISAMVKWVRGLETDKLYSDYENRLRFKRVGENEYKILITKKGNRSLYTDDELRSLIQKAAGQSADELPDFVQNAGDMTASLLLHDLDPFLKRLDKLGLTCMSTPRELEDWEIENEEDWKTKKTHEREYSYKLGKPYGQGSNPTTDFIEYHEPSEEHKYGVVIYGRPLTDKERYNYGLIPIFQDVEQPYQDWKSYINQSPPLKKEFVEMVKTAKSHDLVQALLDLGYFITNNPHEDGNPEFVFGQFSEPELGWVAYEDTIGEISQMQLLHAQLKIELELT